MTIVGVIVMMLTISPLLTLITVGVLPLSFLITRVIAPRSQKHFAAQWKNLGELNGHVEEMYTGHAIVKAFGRERADRREVQRHQREGSTTRAGAPSSSPAS